MKKSNLFKQLGALSAVVGLGGSLLLSGCGEEKKVPSQAKVQATKTVEAAKPAHPAALDATYEAFRKSFEGFSYTPRAGFYQGKARVLVGFGTPVTQEQFVKLASSYDGLGDKNVDTKKREVFATVLSGNYLPETHQNFRIQNGAIREYTKQFIASLENIKLRPLCEEKGFSYDSLDPRVKAVMINIDLSTGGKLETYNNFLTAVGKKDWKTAVSNCTVTEETYNKNHPQAPQDTASAMNKSNRELLKKIVSENAALTQLRQGNSR